MKTEPELIDIYAMFALMALMQKPSKVAKSKIDVAYEAYEQAQAMLDVREDFMDKRGD
jgi:hypothetical protein|tara:strand:+ start:980 stop:1153 length:174 start_codon:yes stop_codon:yes gene_type:complete